MSKRSQLDWVGNVAAERFYSAEIATIDQLLIAGRTRDLRKSLAHQTGISSRRIFTWINKAELARIKGVGFEYAELLGESDVCCVEALRNQSASDLHKKLVKINKIKKLVKRVPAISRVESWIQQAQAMESQVEH